VESVECNNDNTKFLNNVMSLHLFLVWCKTNPVRTGKCLVNRMNVKMVCLFWIMWSCFKFITVFLSVWNRFKVINLQIENLYLKVDVYFKLCAREKLNIYLESGIINLSELLCFELDISLVQIG